MAWVFDPTPEVVAAYAEWCAGRPDGVRQTAERFPPWELFVIRQTKQPVHVVGFAEDGTVRVRRDPQFDWLAGVTHDVFGVNPDDLVPGEPRPFPARP